MKAVLGYIALLVVLTAGTGGAETAKMGVCEDWVGSVMGDIKAMEYLPSYQERDWQGERFAGGSPPQNPYRE